MLTETKKVPDRSDSKYVSTELQFPMDHNIECSKNRSNMMETWY